MNVYIETNFILELAFVQPQHESCHRIVDLGEANRINLLVPAYSLAEPYETLLRYTNNRNRLADEGLKREFKEIGKSAVYRETAAEVLEVVTTFLSRTVTEDTSRLSSVVQRLLKGAEVIPLDTEIFALALRYQDEYGLKPKDSLVFASIMYHLMKTAPPKSVFFNKDKNDFDNIDITNRLASHQCKLFASFERGVEYIQSQI